MHVSQTLVLSPLVVLSLAMRCEAPATQAYGALIDSMYSGTPGSPVDGTPMLQPLQRP